MRERTAHGIDWKIELPMTDGQREFSFVRPMYHRLFPLIDVTGRHLFSLSPVSKPTEGLATTVRN